MGDGDKRCGCELGSPSSCWLDWPTIAVGSRKSAGEVAQEVSW